MGQEGCEYIQRRNEPRKTSGQITINPFTAMMSLENDE